MTNLYPEIDGKTLTSFSDKSKIYFSLTDASQVYLLMDRYERLADRFDALEDPAPLEDPNSQEFQEVYALRGEIMDVLASLLNHRAFPVQFRGAFTALYNANSYILEMMNCMVRAYDDPELDDKPAK